MQSRKLKQFMAFLYTSCVRVPQTDGIYDVWQGCVLLCPRLLALCMWLYPKRSECSMKPALQYYGTHSEPVCWLLRFPTSHLHSFKPQPFITISHTISAGRRAHHSCVCHRRCGTRAETVAGWRL